MHTYSEEMKQHTINRLEVPEGFASSRGASRGCHLPYLRWVFSKYAETYMRKLCWVYYCEAEDARIRNEETAGRSDH